MHRLLAVLQASVYTGLAWELTHRSTLDAGLLGLGAAAQLGITIGWGRRRLVASLAGISLASVLVPWARLFAAAMHVQAALGPETGAQMLGTFGATLVVLPWVLVVPLTQLVATGWGRAGLALPFALLPGLFGPRLDPPARLDPFAMYASPPRRTASHAWAK